MSQASSAGPTISGADAEGPRPDIAVARARPGERALLDNLLQLYIHDFSEFWAERDEGELGADGRFAPYPLDSYWRDADRVPLIVRRTGVPIGFALVNAHSHIGRPVERAIAEFFIVRMHRRGGAGTAVAWRVFGLFPGTWEVAVARRNLGALAFWRQAIGGAAGLADLEELDVVSAEWDGWVFRFRIA